MTRTEKLSKITKICKDNLKLAKKRTPGAWNVSFKKQETGSYSISVSYLPKLGGSDGVIAEGWEAETAEADDLQFAAACAGTAEAGWEVILKMIDALRMYNEADLCGRSPYAFSISNIIIDSWEASNALSRVE